MLPFYGGPQANQGILRVDVNRNCREMVQAVGDACYHNDMKSFHELVFQLQRGHCEDNACVKTYENQSYLHMAARCGKLDLLRHLLSFGGRISSRTTRGQTPLHLAALCGYVLVVKCLLEHKTSGYHALNNTIDYFDNERKTALALAAKYGHLQVVQCLLDKGADVNAVDKYRFGPLYWAVMQGHCEVVKVLLEKGANLDGTTGGDTALMKAVEQRNLAVVKLLVEHGADVQKDDYGLTPLDKAIMNNDVLIAQHIMAVGYAPIQEHTLSCFPYTLRRKYHPLQLATSVEMQNAINKEIESRKNVRFMRSVIPHPTADEQAGIDKARREAEGDGGQVDGQGQAFATTVEEGSGQDQASAVAEEDDDDSGSDEEHEVAYLKSLKRQRSK
jgi:ankyrin repeat protein